MRKHPRALLLAALWIAGGQAHAGLFSDDEARQQVQQVTGRVSSLEEAGKQQAEINRQQADSNKQQTDAANRQSSALLDLQSQFEAQNTELRTLRGQNEELLHGLQDAEKRQKDFYIDLDTRLRHIEEIQAKPPVAAAPAAASAAAPALPVTPAVQAGPADDAADDPAIQNRAYEAAYKLFKELKYEDAIGAFQDFLKQYPASVHVPNVHYEMGSIYLAQKNCRNALTSLQLLPGKFSYSPKTPDAMLSIAACQGELGDKAASKKSLQQIISKYPGSETASEARKRLANLK